LSKIKQRVDLHSNNLTQIALHAYITGGLLETHIQKLRYGYAQRLKEVQLRVKASSFLHCQIPKGGVFLWCRIPKEVPAERLLEVAVKKGLTFVPGNWMSGVGLYDHHIRLAFTHPSHEGLKKGLDLISDAISAYKAYQF
jgi:DNA-binding transcriptional MocR family regulator